MAIKQKIEMKIFMGSEKCRQKAMRIAAEKDGIDSIAVDGDKLVVTGVGVDLAGLARSLQKKIGCTEIVTVVEVKKEEKKVEEPQKPDTEKPQNPDTLYLYPPPLTYVTYDPAPDHICCIM